MTTSRHDVFEAVARLTDAAAVETTTEAELAATLSADADSVGEHVAGLVDCGLVHRYPNGSVRMTATGEAVADLDVEDVVVVAQTPQEE